MSTVTSEYVAEKLGISAKSCQALLKKSGAKKPKTINTYDKILAEKLIATKLEEFKPIEKGLVSRDDLIKEYAIRPKTIDDILRNTPIARIYTNRKNLCYSTKLWRSCEVYPYLENATLRSEIDSKKAFSYDSNLINFLSGRTWKLS